jgi:hypothetical protein
MSDIAIPNAAAAAASPRVHEAGVLAGSPRAPGAGEPAAPNQFLVERVRAILWTSFMLMPNRSGPFAVRFARPPPPATIAR